MVTAASNWLRRQHPELQPSSLCPAPELSALGGRRDKEGKPTSHPRDKKKGDQDRAELIHDTTLASTEPQHAGPAFSWACYAASVIVR
ncbi:hypothetical protein MRS44_012421 [Fusarium solani]|uniref:uncharacterized protein n=1 Tax=Fusarium solani TaxID=169388 RepID=UPI0032C47729|nr:hypothetical protein MRS44_012421 [Fusarium solani]